MTIEGGDNLNGIQTGDFLKMKFSGAAQTGTNGKSRSKGNGT